MKKKSNAVDTVLNILFVIACLISSWSVTCGITKLITMCFGWEFSFGATTGSWLIFVLLNWMRLRSNKE